jgi:hypothetical protein
VKLTLFLIKYKFIFIVFILGLFLFIFKKDKTYFKNLLFLCSLYLFSSLAIYRFLMDLNINYISEEGSRWVYLPSVFLSWFFIYLFLFFIKDLKKNVKIFFYSFLVIFYIFLNIELIYNNLNWNEAAKISEKIIFKTDELLKNNNYGGVVLLGLPDSYHGAYIFRNNFKEALEIKTGAKPDMIVTKFRTLFDFENSWNIEKIDKNQIFFIEINKNKNIIADKNLKSFDYDFELVNPVKNNYAVNYIYSSDKF